MLGLECAGVWLLRAVAAITASWMNCTEMPEEVRGTGQPRPERAAQAHTLQTPRRRHRERWRSGVGARQLASPVLVNRRPRLAVDMLSACAPGCRYLHLSIADTLPSGQPRINTSPHLTSPHLTRHTIPTTPGPISSQKHPALHAARVSPAHFVIRRPLGSSLARPITLHDALPQNPDKCARANETRGRGHLSKEYLGCR
jgi:hypothetical protein